jgi:hypothetical protein
MIRMSASAQDHVDAYIEYDRIVGDADGGKMFTEEEYAQFKANAILARANRIYVSWRNMQTGMDCRMVGPTSPCFCGHRYKQHATDNTNKKMHCRQAGCPCQLYDYVPVRGTQDVKCTCKHSYDVHNVTGKRKCKQSACGCVGFNSSLSCACRDQYGVHQTVFETKEERMAQGRPVDNLAGGGQGYEALGGITNFSSLIDGVDRLELGAGGGQAALEGDVDPYGAPPPRAKKLTAEDEFALYDAKYKKSAISTGPRRGGAGASSSAAAASAAGQARGGSAGEERGMMRAAPAGYAAPAASGEDALNLFLTSVVVQR